MKAMRGRIAFRKHCVRNPSNARCSVSRTALAVRTRLRTVFGSANSINSEQLALPWNQQRRRSRAVCRDRLERATRRDE